MEFREVIAKRRSIRKFRSDTYIAGKGVRTDV